MEYKIRQKDDGICDYTGQRSGVLIKLYDKDEKETGWMSADALKAALNLVSALDGSLMQRFMPPDFPSLPPKLPDYTPPPIVTVTTGTSTSFAGELQQAMNEIGLTQTPKLSVKPPVQKKNLELIRQVEADCRDLLENPPPNGLGKEDSSSIGEIHIREVISEYKDLFRGSENDLYNVINKFFGMPRVRFDTIIGKAVL